MINDAGMVTSRHLSQFAWTVERSGASAQPRSGARKIWAGLEAYREHGAIWLAADAASARER